MKKRLFCFILFPIIIYLIGLPTETVSIPDTNQVVNIPEPVPPPPAVREEFELDPFYQQWIDVEGLPVVASEKVSPYAIKEAAWLIRQMIGHRPEVLHVLAQKQVRFTVIGYTEILTDIPEYSDQGPDFLTFRTRGLGGQGLSGHIAVSAPEESLLHYPDSNKLYAVMIHEFAHAVDLFGLDTVAPTFDNRLKSAYDTAMANGLWQGTYAATDRREYWAEGTHAWFYPKGLDSFNGNTRQALKVYDPGLAALLTEVYGDGKWRYTPPAVRTHLPHLQGFDLQDSPTSQGWPELEELYLQFTNPNSDGNGRWTDLRPYDSSLIPSLNESRTAGAFTTVAFVNRTQVNVLIYWMAQDGTEGFWRRLPPDPKHIRWTRSRVNDIWLIKDLNGKNLAVFQAVEQIGRALIDGAPLITPGLSKISGDNQAGVSGAVLTEPFVIEVRDENGSVLEGISVTFTVTAGDGTLSVTRAITDENGRAQSTFTLGPNLGANTVSVSAGGIAEPVIFNAVAIEPVNVPDPNLRAAIATVLGRALDDSIVPSEMVTLPELNARDASISNLTGLEFATNLTTLRLHNNRITDISPLSSLTELRGLFLDNNDIADISPLSGLIQLEALGLGGNGISDSAALSGLTNLTRLRLGHNHISDLSPLVANTGLGSGDEVDVRGNPLSYLSIMAHIPALQRRGVTVEFDDTAAKPPDVNGDGSVNVLDLILIASELENEGTNIAADIDGNGVVDILDIVLVAGMFESAAAAPSVQPQVPETLTAVEVQQWLTDVRSLEVQNPIMKRGIMVLEQLLVSLTPTETELLPNYPNPFNPETWIPYRLAEDAFVALTIYDLSGQVVRALDIGHRTASAYESRSKAVYWDGRNDVGEQVASGVYFYTLTAGDYSATRKMLILK